MKQQFGLIILALAILAAAYLVASANRYQHVPGTLYDSTFDRWTGRYRAR